MELLDDLRSAVTVIAFATFIGIVFWAWSGRRKRAFDEAARLPLMEEDTATVSGGERSAR